jgi:hypothetical protein
MDNASIAKLRHNLERSPAERLEFALDATAAGGEFDPIRILKALVGADVDFVVVAGVGASLNGSTSNPHDIDITVRTDSETITRLDVALTSLKAHPVVPRDEAVGMRARDFRARPRWTVPVKWRSECGDLDILPALAGVPSYDSFVQTSWTADLGGSTVAVRVASRSALIKVLKATRRPHKSSDAERLAELAWLHELVGDKP